MGPQPLGTQDILSGKRQHEENEVLPLDLSIKTIKY